MTLGAEGERAKSCMAFLRSGRAKEMYHLLAKTGDILDEEKDNATRSGRPNEGQKKYKKQQNKEAIAMIKDGKTSQQAADHLGISKAALEMRLSRMGVTVTSLRRRKRLEEAASRL